MVNYQVVGLGGNLTADVKIFSDKVAKFSIAVNSGFGEKKKTAFINCIAFSQSFHEKVWPVLAKLKKGSNLGVKGEFVTETYGEGDAKKTTLQLIVREFTLFYSDKPKTEGDVKSNPSASEGHKQNELPSIEEDDSIPF